MIPVQQRIVNSGTPSNPKDIPGDCFKACVASILELDYDEVPHFVNYEVTETDPVTGEVRKLDWYTGINVWLERRGFPLWMKHWTNNLSADEIRALRAERGLQDGESMSHNDHYRKSTCPDWVEGYWIASVISENIPDGTHAIVMLGDQVAFDPSPRPRRTPYEFIGGKMFVCTNPAVVTR